MSLEHLKSSKIDSPTKFSISILSENTKNKFPVNHGTLNSTLKSFAIPAYTDSSLENFYDNNWWFTRGRTEIFQIQMTFRSVKSLENYNAFLKWLNDNKNKYSSEQYLSISLNYEGNYLKDVQRTITFNKCIMTNLSELNFEHSSIGQTLDFTVGFKTGYINKTH